MRSPLSRVTKVLAASFTAAIVIHVALLSPPAKAQKSDVGGETHEGVAIQVDLPHDQHVHNFAVGFPPAGLCVYASLDMAARWHNVPGLVDVIHKIPRGGAGPRDIDNTMRQYAPGVPYIQYEGVSPQILDRALATDRPALVTYGYSPRYGARTIYHMVLLVYLDQQYACVLDNNFPGTYEWMPRAEFIRRWTWAGGQGWAVVLLVPPPPPVPSN